VPASPGAELTFINSPTMDLVFIVKGILGVRAVDGFRFMVPPIGQSLSNPSSFGNTGGGGGICTKNQSIIS